MHRQNVIVVALLVVVSAFVVTAGYAKGGGPLGLLNTCVAVSPAADMVRKGCAPAMHVLADNVR